MSYVLVSGWYILKCNVELFRDTHSSPITSKVTHRPTKVGKYSVWGSVRGVCGGGSVRDVCGGSVRGGCGVMGVGVMGCGRGCGVCVGGEDVGWVCGGGCGVCVWGEDVGWVCGGGCGMCVCVCVCELG